MNDGILTFEQYKEEKNSCVRLTKKRAEAIYEILVNFGGALKSYRRFFIHHHVESKWPCAEYWFTCKLGFECVYVSETNKIEYHLGPHTPTNEKFVSALNDELAKL